MAKEKGIEMTTMNSFFDIITDIAINVFNGWMEIGKSIKNIYKVNFDKSDSMDELREDLFKQKTDAESLREDQRNITGDIKRSFDKITAQYG